VRLSTVIKRIYDDDDDDADDVTDGQVRPVQAASRVKAVSLGSSARLVS